MSKKTRIKNKNLICIFVSTILVFSLWGCGSPPAEETKPVKELPPGSAAANLTDQRMTEIISGTGLDPLSGTDDATKSVTVMVYMNGSDLETEMGMASADISEMISSGVGKNVNVILQTMGTRQWHNDAISSDTAQTFRIKDGKLELIRDKLGQLDCTSEQTLSDFIGFCKTNYPADRNIFIFWDHGGGPVYGFGFDEWQSPTDSLTLSEMAHAFAANNDIHFDIIGMDCCIMASIETCLTLAPFCSYAVLSEDFESGLGWSYEEWLKELEENPAQTPAILGKKIIDNIISDNESDPMGDSACMAMFNESTAVNLFNAWKAYAYKNQDAFFTTKYSKKYKARGRGSGFADAGGFSDFDYDYDPDYEFDYESYENDMSYVTLADYYITDVLALIESVDSESEEAKNLTSALKAAITYYGHTSDKNELTGMSVSLPYGDSDLYEQIKNVYKDTNIDKDYLEWLGNFVTVDAENYSFGSFADAWNGWGDYERDYGGATFNSQSAGEHAYNYGTGSFYGRDDSFLSENWVYDYEYDLWYLDNDGVVFMYDDESNSLFYYDKETDETYEYNYDTDEWEFMGYS